MSCTLSNSLVVFLFCFKAWSEQHRRGAPKRVPECINQLKMKHRRAKLPNTISIDAIYESNFLSLTSVLEAVILDAFALPGSLYLEVYLIIIIIFISRSLSNYWYTCGQ